MPRVYTKTKNRAGRERRCTTCGRTIEPGQRYYQWSFRYGGTRYACSEHYPKQSQLTQSKMSTVYAAIEDAEPRLGDAETIEEVNDIVQGVAETVREVAEEYREADEAFGGMGATEHAERADELESWADTLEEFEAEEPDEFDAEAWDEDNPIEDFEGDSAARDAAREEAREEHASEALEKAREEAQDALGESPY